MEEKDRRALEQVLADHLDEELLQLLLSDPRDKEKHQKVKVRPLLLKGQLVFQMEEFIGKQVFHKNLSAGEAAAALTALLREDFGRCEIWSEKGWAQALVSRKGKVTVKRKPKARRAGAGENAGAAGIPRIAGGAQGSGPEKCRTAPDPAVGGEQASGPEKRGTAPGPAAGGEQASEPEKCRTALGPAAGGEQASGPEKRGTAPGPAAGGVQASEPEKCRTAPGPAAGGVQASGAEKIRARSAGAMQPAGMRPTGSLQLAERLAHNRKKTYILQEGHPVPFLRDLGVMTETGKVVRAKYDKFRQINRFLEFIEDILPQLSKDRENVIIDFGCGKSYLTFAMYHYLTLIKSYPVRVIGLDLKQEVIDHCNALSRKYGFDHLQFYHGDIASYEGVDQVDMVVTLHACDTATDYALAKAVAWKAKVILSVPCCQHEWNKQMKNALMEPILRYGILKERIAALYTDGLRAELLEHAGYRTQVLEFIDMEHTPKNILIRAVRQGRPKDNEEEIRKLLAFWEVEPTLAKLLLGE